MFMFGMRVAGAGVGVSPNCPRGMELSSVHGVELSEGARRMMEVQAMGKMVKDGVAFVPPELAVQLFEGIHSRLQAAGIDGVKIDAIHVVE